MHLFNIIRRSVFQLAAASDGTKKRLFFVMPSRVVTRRTLILSTCLNKDSSPKADEKLDLDGWKNVMRSAQQEETTERTSQNEADSAAAVTRDLIEMWRLSGRLVPENISEEDMKVLNECPTKSSKRKYLKFLAIKENKKKAEREKREKRNEAKKERMLNTQENTGGELQNTFLPRLWARSQDAVYNWRAAQSMIFGQPLVYDMNYENYMTPREMVNTVKQLLECEGANRRALDPFHLHYCNLKAGGAYHKEFVKRYGEAWDKLLVTVTEKSYIEVFPKDQLVYLTADSPNVMKTFEHDKIYIIGSIVDKSMKTGLSFANAKRLELVTARLPLDSCLQWGEGAKNLTLDQMMRILLALKDTGDWKEALQFVPQRKHGGFVDMSSWSKQQIDTWKKTRLPQIMASQRTAHKQFAQNFSRRQAQKNWWDDVS